MANYIATDSELTAVANKIRSKTGGTASLEWPDGFVSGINSISGGGSPTLETVTKTYTPGTSQQTDTITPGTGYDGIGEVDVTVGAISGSYVGSGVTRRSSSDLTASGATVTAPAGYYESAASKAVASGSAATPATSITANPTISVSSGGLITASVSAAKSITPSVTSGYVSSGTAGTATVSGSATEQLTVQGAQTIHPSTSDQTIASGKYLTGTQTVKAVTVENLTAGNIKKDVVIKIGDSTDDDCVTSVTGTYAGGGGGTTVATGTVTPTERTLTISFDAGKTGCTNVLVLPTSETPLKSNGRTSYYFVGSSNTYLKGIRGGSNSGGSGTGNPTYSTSDDYFSQSGNTITITLSSSSGGYWETISYTWWAW